MSNQGWNGSKPFHPSLFLSKLHFFHREIVLQFDPCLDQIRAAGALGDVECVADFFVGVAFHDVQIEHGSVGWAEGLDGSEDFLLGQVGQRIGVVVVQGVRRVEVVGAAADGFSVKINAGVDHDRANPRRKRSAGLKTGDVLENFDEPLVQQVECLVFRAGVSEADTHHFWVVFFVQLLLRRAVVAGERGDEFLFRRFGLREFKGNFHLLIFAKVEENRFRCIEKSGLKRLVFWMRCLSWGYFFLNGWICLVWAFAF